MILAIKCKKGTIKCKKKKVLDALRGALWRLKLQIAAFRPRAGAANALFLPGGGDDQHGSVQILLPHVSEDTQQGKTWEQN